MFRSIKTDAGLLTALTTIFLITSLSGCGHSEKEWQAQLDKYNKLAAANQAEIDEHEKTRAEFEAAKMRVVQLGSELEKMGVNIDALTSQVQQYSTSPGRRMTMRLWRISTLSPSSVNFFSL